MPAGLGVVDGGEIPYRPEALPRKKRNFGNALRLIERFTRTAPDTITYEVTVDDPKVFTRPWIIRMPIYQVKGVSRVLENECCLNAEDAGKPIRGGHPENRGRSDAPKGR